MSLVSCADGSMSLSENPNAVVCSSLSFLCNKSCNSKIVQKPKACITDCSDARLARSDSCWSLLREFAESCITGDLGVVSEGKPRGSLRQLPR